MWDPENTRLLCLHGEIRLNKPRLKVLAALAGRSWCHGAASFAECRYDGLNILKRIKVDCDKYGNKYE